MSPTYIKPSSKGPYVWAVLVMVLIGAIVVLAICAMRPKLDALEVLADVVKWLAPTTAAILAYLKSEETHLSVNSRLDAMMLEHGKVNRAEGILQGVADEQARASDEKVKIAAAKVLALAAVAAVAAANPPAQAVVEPAALLPPAAPQGT